MLNSRARFASVFASSFAFAFLVASPAYSLVGGYAVHPGQFPSVFIMTSHEEDLADSYCTAAKVAKDWILTAAHCVDEAHRNRHQRKRMADIKPGQALQYSFATNEIKTAERLLVLEVRLPLGTLPDVALIRVAPQGTFAAKPCAAVSRGFVPAHLHVTLVGYGAEGEGEIQLRPARLTTHGAFVSTTQFLAQEVMKLGTTKQEIPPVLHFFGVINWPHLEGHTNLGSGDSGGPVFISGTQTIVGVNSEAHCPTEKPDCQVTNNSWFARLNQLPTDFWPQTK